MTCWVILIGLVAMSPTTPAEAGEPESTLDDLTAREAVCEGNRRLLAGIPDGALEAYDRADELQPDAREIAFVQGLAHYDLKEFDKAREAFERVAASVGDALAADALYSLGASDHLEALESIDDPQLALSLLESAMRRYHSVLDQQPRHEAARDANFKAASIWRRLKQQMQEQQQQQSSGENENEDQKEGDQQEQDQQQSQDRNRQDEPKDQDEQQEEQQESESSEHSEEKQRQSAAQEEEQVSREQAQRQLREMMQALRERRKARQEPVGIVPVAPVDKDW